MSAARTLRALPTLLRVGVAETVAYRAEFLVWILTTTLPLVMLGLWTSVAAEAPFRGYTSSAICDASVNDTRLSGSIVLIRARRSPSWISLP